MEQNKISQKNFHNVEAYILTENDLEPFYPLLPREHCKADLDPEFAILGAVGMDEKGTYHAIGAMVLRIVRNDMLLLKWMLVSPQYQHQGVGYTLMNLAQDIAKEIKMQIVGNFSQDKNEGEEGIVYRYLKKNDFVIYPEAARSYYTTLEEVGKEAFFAKQMKGNHVMLLEEVPSHMIIALYHELKEKGQLFIGTISKKNVLSEISLVVVKEGIIRACIIFREIRKEEIELAFVYTESKSTAQMPLLLIQAYQVVKEKYPPTTELVIPCVSESSSRLVEALVPTAKIERVAYSVQWLPRTTLK